MEDRRAKAISIIKEKLNIDLDEFTPLKRRLVVNALNERLDKQIEYEKQRNMELTKQIYETRNKLIKLTQEMYG